MCRYKHCYIRSMREREDVLDTQKAHAPALLFFLMLNFTHMAKQCQHCKTTNVCTWPSTFNIYIATCSRHLKHPVFIMHNSIMCIYKDY